MEKNLPKKSNLEVATGEGKIQIAGEGEGAAGKISNSHRDTNLSKG